MRTNLFIGMHGSTATDFTEQIAKSKIASGVCQIFLGIFHGSLCTQMSATMSCHPLVPFMRTADMMTSTHWQVSALQRKLPLVLQAQADDLRVVG